MGRSGEQEEGQESTKSKWLWPVGVATTGLAGLALLLLRGCWHSRMSWPVRMQGCTYQVCLGCGVKRLFDEKNFRSYGPFSYDLEELAAWSKSRQERPMEPPKVERPAS